MADPQPSLVLNNLKAVIERRREARLAAAQGVSVPAAPQPPEPDVSQAVKPQSRRRRTTAKTSAVEEPMLRTERDHLQFVADYGKIGVATFRELSANRDAMQVLTGYVTLGLLQRDWHRGAGVYSLTAAGWARLQELQAQLGAKAE